MLYINMCININVIIVIYYVFNNIVIYLILNI